MDDTLLAKVVWCLSVLLTSIQAGICSKADPLIIVSIPFWNCYVKNFSKNRNLWSQVRGNLHLMYVLIGINHRRLRNYIFNHLIHYTCAFFLMFPVALDKACTALSSLTYFCTGDFFRLYYFSIYKKGNSIIYAIKSQALHSTVNFFMLVQDQ